MTRSRIEKMNAGEFSAVLVALWNNVLRAPDAAAKERAKGEWRWAHEVWTSRGNGK